MVFQSEFIFCVAFGFDDPKPYLFSTCVRSWSGNYIAIFLDEKDLLYSYLHIQCTICKAFGVLSIVKRLRVSV